MKKEFYSNGKLLITGEYLVLDGAKAFALPTKFGQKLTVEKSASRSIHWTSYDTDGSVWFEEQIGFEEIIEHKDRPKTESIKNTLIKILYEAYLLNPSFIVDSSGYRITTSLTFPKNWGLGTSSTLINNIGQWLEINSFDLLYKSFGGSGYDIACAQNDNPILFQLKNGLPIVEKIDFKPDFIENLFFVYLDKKQSSKASIISYYNNKNENLLADIALNNATTTAVLEAKNLSEFAFALQEHETKMREILEMPTIKELLFVDFDGFIKSLGAWGGDFVLAISNKNPTDYFNEKGFKTIIPYKEMIL